MAHGFILKPTGFQFLEDFRYYGNINLKVSRTKDNLFVKFTMGRGKVEGTFLPLFYKLPFKGIPRKWDSYGRIYYFGANRYQTPGEFVEVTTPITSTYYAQGYVYTRVPFASKYLAVTKNGNELYLREIYEAESVADKTLITEVETILETPLIYRFKVEGLSLEDGHTFEVSDSSAGIKILKP